MLTDYKISTWVDDGKEISVTVRFYRGNVTTEEERTPQGLEQVTRYRRTGKLREKIFTFPLGTTREAVESVLRQELKKGKTRTPIPEQN